jgi:hypothetical protein
MLIERQPWLAFIPNGYGPRTLLGFHSGKSVNKGRVTAWRCEELPGKKAAQDTPSLATVLNPMVAAGF